MVQSNGVFSLFHNFLSEIVEIGNNVEDKFWINSFNFYIYILDTLRYQILLLLLLFSV